jgi:hypothetical protein
VVVDDNLGIAFIGASLLLPARWGMEANNRLQATGLLGPIY